MEITGMLSQASILGLLSLLVGILPIGFGVAYAVRPSEPRLALMRPISLGAIFGGLSGTLSGAINVFRFFWAQNPVDYRIVAIGTAESLVPLFVACSSLTIAWLCVAVGLRRHS